MTFKFPVNSNIGDITFNISVRSRSGYVLITSLLLS